MAGRSARSEFTGGKWRITWMETWDQEFVELLGPGFFHFDADGLGQFRFGAVEGQLDCRFSGNRVEFSWRGCDDTNEACGRGFAEIVGGELRGRIYLHCGDDSPFRAARLAAGGDRSTASKRAARKVTKS